jgi:hypothetical protein
MKRTQSRKNKDGLGLDIVLGFLVLALCVYAFALHRTNSRLEARLAAFQDEVRNSAAQNLIKMAEDQEEQSRLRKARVPMKKEQSQKPE